MYSIYTIIHASFSFLNWPKSWTAEIIEQQARQSGFQRRRPRKITPQGFVHSCLVAVASGSASLRRQAILLGLREGTVLSKQALHQRMTESSRDFLQGLLAHLLRQRLDVPASRPGGFARILVQDSTCLTLPARHLPRFPGSANALQRGACARIQCLFDLLSERFLHFSLSPFTRNDQAASQDPLPWLRPGDLLLRDLGYFTLRSLQAVAQVGAFFLTRRRSDVALFDPLTGRPIDLLRLLSSTHPTDCPVLLGASQRLPVRLLAFPLPQALADARRRRARADRDRRLNHPQHYLALLSWAIFLTNADSRRLPARQAAELYRLRWRVEILFKGWKSHLGLADLTSCAPRQIEARLFALLLLAVLFHSSLPLAEPSLSSLKLAPFFADFLLVASFLALPPPSPASSFLAQILAHCSYEKRRRFSFPALLPTSLS